MEFRRRRRQQRRLRAVAQVVACTRRAMGEEIRQNDEEEHLYAEEKSGLWERRYSFVDVLPKGGRKIIS